MGQTYHSSFQGKSRGTAILLHKSVPFVHSSTVSDSNGRFVIVVGQILNTRVVLANIYAPNYDDDAFFMWQDGPLSIPSPSLLLDLHQVWVRGADCGAERPAS